MPQFAVSVLRLASHPSRRVPLQSANPGRQAGAPQTPAAQAAVVLGGAGQVRPQAPQFDASVRVSTHAALQQLVPGLQAGPPPHPATTAHRPISQRVPGRQTTPQPPQLFGSTSVSTQRSLQQSEPGPHAGPAPQPTSPMQVPATQRCVTPHTRPHAPQFEPSLNGSTHAAPQQRRVPAQGGPPPQPIRVSQRPARQVCPSAHRRPHAPQLVGSTERFTQAAPQHEAPCWHEGPMPQPPGRTH